MADRAATIENLRRQLTKLEVATNIIRRSIQDLENEREISPAQPRPTIAPTRPAPQVKDRNGNNILIGSRILFLTKGKYNSTAGVVTRFSRNNTRVFAKDIDGVEIPRAPRNVKVIKDAE